MTMRALLLLLALWLAAAPASAQQALRLRASEFSSFSRVVLDLPADARWEVERDGRSLRLRLPDTGGELDARAIFPERRVSRVLRARGASLMIRLWRRLPPYASSRTSRGAASSSERV